MNTPASKAELLQEMRDGRRAWESLLEQAPEARMREPGVEGVWSVKEILAHICAYQQYMAAMLQDVKEPDGNATALLDSYYQMQLTMYRAQNPQIPEQLQDVRGDMVNEVFTAAYRYKTISEVRRLETEAFQKLVKWVEAFDDAELSAPFANTGRTLLEVIPRQSYIHYAQHAPAIQAWLERPGA